MTSPRKSPRVLVGRYRTYMSPDGLVYGELRKGEGDSSELLLPDGAVLPLPDGARTLPASDPEVVPAIPFAEVLPDEAPSALRRLLEQFQTEYSNPDERRQWAQARLERALPEGRETDELIRFRYEEYRRGIASALSALLEAQVSSGQSALLLECLESDKPGEVRRVALASAAALGVKQAASSVCAAAIHRTQLDLARVAIGAIAQLEPARLPLVAASAQAGIATPEVLEAAWSLPEWRVLTGQSVMAADDDAPDAFVPERAAHLLAALDAADAVSAWERLGTRRPDVCPLVATALTELLQPLAQKESPTAYETALRIGLARALLAGDSAAFDRSLRLTAARLVTRDLSPEEAARVMLDVRDASASLMLSTALSNPKSRSASALLRAAAEHRPSLGGHTSSVLLAKVRQNELEGAARAFALALLAGTSEGREAARGAASRELGTVGAEAEALLARALVSGDAVPDIARVRESGRPAVLRALGEGSPGLAAQVLRDLRAIASTDSIPGTAEATQLPSDWIDASAELRDELRAWLPQMLEADAAGSALFESAMKALTKDAPERWSDWEEAERRTCMNAMSRANTSDAATFFFRIIGTRAEGSQEQQLLLHEFFSSVVSRHPEVLDGTSSAFPREIALRQALKTTSHLHRERSANEARRQVDAASRARTLGRALEECAAKASAAVGTEESIGALLKRLADDIRDELGASDPASNTQIAEFLRLAETSDEATLTREALRGAGTRGMGSPASLSFFREQCLLRLDRLGLVGMRAFLAENERFVDKLGPGALGLIAEALLLAGGQAAEAKSFLGGPRSTQVAVHVAIRVEDRMPEAAFELVRLSGGEISDVVQELVELRRSADQLKAEEGGSADPVAILVRRIAQNLDALEQLILPVMRLRRILSRSGLVPVEPVLGEIREFDDLSASFHRVMGMSADRGPHEVQTFGIRAEGARQAIVPALVARVLDEDQARKT